MPPKNKGKKGGKKNVDDDEFWEKKEAALAAAETPEAGSEEDVPKPAKGGKNKKAGGLFDLLDDGDALDEEEGGDLMATIRASAAKKDKKKKNKKVDYDDDDEDAAPPPAADTKPNMDDEWPEDDVKPKKGKKDKKSKKKAPVDEDKEMDEPAAEAPVPTTEATAVNLDDEWPEEDVKPKKGKKGKKGKKQVEEDEDDIDAVLERAAAERRAAEAAMKVSEPTPAAAEPEPEAAEEQEEGEDEGPKILTKAQKEKLKKEKEKAKKKAQAAAKKTQTTETAPAEDAASPAAEPTAEAEEDEGDEDAAGGDKKKKKKKKAAAKPAEPAAPAKGKKVPAHILAMQAAMEEKKRVEEEARRVEDERLAKIEEEERRLAEEEEKIAAAKAAKKAKEKEKQAKAKAEGRALTPAQKREQAAAEARKQAMLASGMTVAGLQDGGAPKKKVVYGNNKKKQQPKPAAQETSSPAPSSPAPAPVEEKKAAAPAKDEDSGDDWDKSEDEVEKVVAGVDKLKVEESEDDWDKSSEDEAPPAPKAAPAAAPAKKVTPASAPVDAPAAKATPAPAASAATKPAPKANGKPAPVEEESSEEEDSSDEETDSDDDSDSDESSDDEAAARKAVALQKIKDRQAAAQAAKSKDDLRSPICCILGHVDTGKTKLLDKIRQTSVQEGEAGGITQQIGATFFPKTAIEEKTQVVNRDGEYQVKIPGLLIIDTPGHESFTNLRTRGSSLCNIAILVVDITHGLEPQTIESLNLLRNGKTPFIVALNKIDRMYGWEAKPNAGFRETLNAQNKSVKSEFEDRVRKTKLAFAEQGLNAEIFDENKNLGKNISLVPTSAITGEGIPDMLMLLVKLTQERMNASLMYISELECTILEVKIIEGLGTTIDVVLSNGVMKEGDTIVLCGTDGPIVTNVRALLTPQPMREMRVKSAYVHHKEVKAALGVKISAPGLEKAIAGARLYVAQDEDEVEAFKDMAMDDLTSLAKFVTKTGKGVWVQASTLGSLEALLTFLEQMKIPVFNFGIGPVHKSTIVKAGTMLDKAPEYAVILAFDVVIEKEAQELAQKAGMKIFSAMIIYHLFDAFTKYMNEVQEAKRKEAAPNAVWPVKMKILKAFAHRDPIILGCDIIEGTMRVGTPVGVVKVDKETGKREIVPLGKITSLEINHKPYDILKKAQIGAGAAVKIERAPHQSAKLYGRHFDDKDDVVSLISRQSIDTLKTNFRDQVEMSDWALIKKMKVEQGVQ
ncbi:translation initiation factor aIF-2 [Kwoniella sp. CBS 6097]